VSKGAIPEAHLEKVGPENLADCGIGCLSDPAHVGFRPKVEWLERRFEEGLRFLLFRDQAGKPLAFLEYVPGEFAWRPVHAEGWIFIHCLWVYSRGMKIGGLGSRLIRACVQEAKEAGATGVAAMVSDGPWMVGRRVFLLNGFQEIAEEDGFQLLIYRLREGPEPRFRRICESLSKYEGLHVVYSAQCPMLPKSVSDMSNLAAEHGIELKVTVLNSAYEAQRAPSYYGVFNLIWNGRLLSDHYVSGGRFRNLLKKEILSRDS
jgi:hypothetical protein